MTPDLRTRYLGLDLRSPIVASSTPLTGDPSFVKQLEDAGVGAVVLPSLFEEEILNDEIELSRALDQGTEQFAEALGYFPAQAEFQGVGDQYLARLEKTKNAVSVPVIARRRSSRAFRKAPAEVYLRADFMTRPSAELRRRASWLPQTSPRC